MVESLLLLTVIACLNVLLAIIGFRGGGILGVIHIGQAIYWFVSYVLRPGILLLIQPQPGIGDSVADWRIASGGYGLHLPGILQPVACGLAAYSLFAIFSLKYSSRLQLSSGRPPTTLKSGVELFLGAYVIGWAFRLVLTALGSSPITETISGMAVVGAAGLIVFSKENNRAHMWFVIVPVIGELSWSVLSASKTPAIAAGLALAIRWAQKGWSRKKVAWSITIAVGGVLAFPLLQNIKMSAADQHVLSTAAANYPDHLQPLMAIIRRFDLFSAMTDATLMGPGHWMPLAEFINRLFLSFVPQVFLPFDKVGVGTLWSTEVRSYSLGTANANVSLAEGFIAEGFVLNGIAGVLVGALFVATLSVAVSRMIGANGIFSVSMGLLMVSYPVLFERGILGSIEIAGKAVQIAFLMAILDLFVRWVSTPRDARKMGDTSPVLPKGRNRVNFTR